MHDIPTHIINYRKNGSEAVDIGTGNIAKQIEFDGSSLTEQVEKYEKGIIMKVYNESPNITAAADKLKLSRQALSYKMKKYGILQNQNEDVIYAKKVACMRAKNFAYRNKQNFLRRDV